MLSVKSKISIAINVLLKKGSLIIFSMPDSRPCLPAGRFLVLDIGCWLFFCGDTFKVNANRQIIGKKILAKIFNLTFRGKEFSHSEFSTNFFFGNFSCSFNIYFVNSHDSHHNFFHKLLGFLRKVNHFIIV